MAMIYANIIAPNGHVYETLGIVAWELSSETKTNVVQKLLIDT